MPVRLSTTVSKISSLPNTTNAVLISEFYHYMENNGASESHTNNSLKTNMAFAKFLGPDVTFDDVKRKEEINGQKAADSDINNSTNPESFTNLNSLRRL